MLGATADHVLMLPGLPDVTHREVAEAYGEELAVLRTALSDLFAFYRQERPSGDCPGDGRHPHGGGWDCPPCDAWRALYERDAQPPAMRSTPPGIVTR